MKKKWLKIFGSFKDAEKADNEYYSKMTPYERLDTMQYLRNLYYKIGGGNYAYRKRLRRVIKIIKSP